MTGTVDMQTMPPLCACGHPGSYRIDFEATCVECMTPEQRVEMGLPAAVLPWSDPAVRRGDG